MADKIYTLTPIASGKPGEEAQPVSSDNPLPTAGKQEAFQLATGNNAAAPVTVYGGDYIFAQLASAYGTVKLQVLGPDGLTWLDLVSKAAVDANGGGTGVCLGTGAVVRAALTGTAGAAATLSRIP